MGFFPVKDRHKLKTETITPVGNKKWGELLTKGIHLTPSMEDYLEMFYRIVKKQGYIRPIDLSEAIKVRPSSVTRMIRKLNEAGFITYEKYRNISLTIKGLRYGRFLVWRDETLKEFFRLVNAGAGLEEQIEGIEHYITPATMSIIRNLILYFRSRPDRLQELTDLQKQTMYPDNEDLQQLRALRAYIFHHN